MNMFSGVVGILAKPVLVEFLLASCGLGALWGFMEAFLFIHIGTYTPHNLRKKNKRNDALFFWMLNYIGMLVHTSAHEIKLRPSFLPPCENVNFFHEKTKTNFRSVK
jgi:hypothetical protein